jgi:spore coat protein U-like protein
MPRPIEVDGHSANRLRARSQQRARQALAALGLTVMLTMAARAGAECSINVTSISFGEYDVFSTLAADITGSLSVSCDADTPFQIALGAGAGSFTAREMRNGPNVLIYNLYTDPTRLSIWGDGSPGTNLLSTSGTGATYTVYGRIPARQNVSAGNYSDTITVTLTF